MERQYEMVDIADRLSFPASVTWWIVSQPHLDSLVCTHVSPVGRYVERARCKGVGGECCVSTFPAHADSRETALMSYRDLERYNDQCAGGRSSGLEHMVTSKLAISDSETRFHVHAKGVVHTKASTYVSLE